MVKVNGLASGNDPYLATLKLIWQELNLQGSLLSLSSFPLVALCVDHPMNDQPCAMTVAVEINKRRLFSEDDQLIRNLSGFHRFHSFHTYLSICNLRDVTVAQRRNSSYYLIISDFLEFATERLTVSYCNSVNERHSNPWKYGAFDTISCVNMQNVDTRTPRQSSISQSASSSSFEFNNLRVQSSSRVNIATEWRTADDFTDFHLSVHRAARHLTSSGGKRN